MPEATMICCDCSEYMRNGDFAPSRFDSEKDAIGIICQAKTQQNHENTVGLIAMGKQDKADVLVNCTGDVGRILASVSKMRIDGSASMLVALQTAQLALKHRKNKKQTQRIIIFVGSPVLCAEKDLIKAGKKLKKNNVAVDIVNFGESEANTPILEQFIAAVNSNDNSNLITVPSGTGRLLSDLLVTSPILSQQQQMDDMGLNANAAAQGAPVGGGGDAPFGGAVNPEEDPEMAMAIQLSLAEERQRLEAQAQAADAAPAQDADGDAVVADAPQNEPAAASAAAAAEASGDSAAQPPAADAPELAQLAEAMDIDENDEELLRALQMSMLQDADDVEPAADAAPADDAPAAGGDDAVPAEATGDVLEEAALNDDEYMDDLLSQLPGLNKEDIDIDELYQNIDDDNPDKKDETGKKDDKQ